MESRSQGNTIKFYPYVYHWHYLTGVWSRFKPLWPLMAWPWPIFQGHNFKVATFTLAALWALLWGVTCIFDFLTLKGHLTVTRARSRWQGHTIKFHPYTYTWYNPTGVLSRFDLLWHDLDLYFKATTLKWSLLHSGYSEFCLEGHMHFLPFDLERSSQGHGVKVKVTSSYHQVPPLYIPLA